MDPNRRPSVEANRSALGVKNRGLSDWPRAGTNREKNRRFEPKIIENIYELRWQGRCFLEVIGRRPFALRGRDCSRRTFMRSTLLAALVLAAVGVGLPATAAAQDPPDPVPIPAPPPPSPAPAPPPAPPPPPRQEQAVPRSSDPGPRMPDTRSPSIDRVPGSDDGGARGRTVTSHDDQGGAVRRPTSSTSGGSGSSGASSGSSGSEGSGAQRRGNVRRPPADGGSGGGVGAVPRDRSRVSNPPRGGGNYGYYNPYYSPYYSRYYDPWGYGAFGLGYFYYSPWAYAGYGYGGPAYYPHYQGAYGFDIGSVRLKVKPRDAEVWVDGYYAGVVDDFDGIFQSLKLDLGAYRIEIRKPGFETLQFDVRVQPDRTITYRSDMKPVP